jgi:hypothetical protein
MGWDYVGEGGGPLVGASLPAQAAGAQVAKIGTARNAV